MLQNMQETSTVSNMTDIDISKPFIIETTMDKWNDIISFNQLFLTNFVFRGQCNALWKLQSSLHRFVENSHPSYVDKNIPVIYEQKMIREFQYKFPLYDTTKHINKENSVEWLTLMQHYGAPTRLLDFSRSIFIALYFALDGGYQNDSIIWAINKSAVQSAYVKSYCEKHDCHTVGEDELNEYIRGIANSVIGRILPMDIKQQVLPIYPEIVNERISIQQGLFLMTNDLRNEFDEVLYKFLDVNDSIIKVKPTKLLNLSYHEQAKHGLKNLVMFKFIIPARFKWLLTQLLIQMNITAETLYPGLSGMAKSLSRLQLRQSFVYDD